MSLVSRTGGSGPPRRSSRVGVSLVEILVVLMILGILAGAVAPAFQESLNRDGLMTAEEQTRQLIERARRTALLRAVPVRLLIDAKAQYWVIAADGGSDSVIATGRLSLPAGTRIEMAPPRAEVRMSATGAIVYADEIGVRHAARAAIIAVVDWDGTGDRHAR